MRRKADLDAVQSGSGLKPIRRKAERAFGQQTATAPAEEPLRLAAKPAYRLATELAGAELVDPSSMACT